MNPTSVDIKDMLEDDSTLGLVFGTNLFIGTKFPYSFCDFSIWIESSFFFFEKKAL